MKLLLILLTGPLLAAAFTYPVKQKPDVQAEIAAYIDAMQDIFSYIDAGDYTSTGAQAAFTAYYSADANLNKYSESTLEYEMSRMPIGGPIIPPCVGCVLQYRQCVKGTSPYYPSYAMHMEQCKRDYQSCMGTCGGN